MYLTRQNKNYDSGPKVYECAACRYNNQPQTLRGKSSRGDGGPLTFVPLLSATHKIRGLVNLNYKSDCVPLTRPRRGEIVAAN